MSGRREAAIALSCYGLYLAVRRAVWTNRGRARARKHSDDIAALERRLHLDVEPALQRVAMRHPRMLDVLNAGYAAGNVALSVGWLVTLHRTGNPIFRRERAAAVLAFCGALPVFLAYPTAPPRTRDGVVDTLAERGLDLEHPWLVRFYNPIAAMPSHHVAFAVVTGFGKAGQHRTGLSGKTWRTYPLVVSGVVLATGNHYTLDAIAGAALGFLARWLTR